MTLTTLAARSPPTGVQLDYVLLRRAFLVLPFTVIFIAPLSPDPAAFAVGAFVPWLILRIVGTPTLPAAVVFYLLWQWLQIYTRTMLGLIDGEELSRGLFGPWVEDAYWYMLASVITLALAFRLVLGMMRPPSPRQATAHLQWRPIDLFLVYLASLIVAAAARVVGDSVGALDQPAEAVARFKIIALFLLFGGVLSSGKGTSLLGVAVIIELMAGFSGLLGDFRGVFIFLFIAALAVRVRWSGMTSLIAAVGAVLLVLLALFWTSVKSEYREFATGSDDSQNVKVSLDARWGYLGSRLASPGAIDWNLASYALMSRLAYVDIFGSVIGVALVSPEPGNVRQWGDALAHVFQPRFLFPDKAPLSDTEVFVRLARGDASEQMRTATSISVGYLAENYVDFGFPGMLFGVFAIGLIVSSVCRYFMAIPLPWLLRESIVMAFLYAIGGNGVEISLPKMFGATLMAFLVYSLAAKFAFPFGLRWLDQRAATARRYEMLRQQSRAAQNPLLK